ncbi:MAG: hypothetical protein HYU25_11005 [Candidatus Rokubacteria bacterium]|nr:hypothetical protein [Candidatus Rokubacteria bacterium]
MSVGLVVALPGAAAAQRIELDGRYWIPDVSAEAKIEGGALPGTTFDFERDLGISREPLADLRLSVFTGPNSKLRLAHTRGDYEGDTILGRTIQFNGSVFRAATRVVSELDMHYARLGWIWQLPLIPGKLKVGPVVEAKAFVVEATLRAPATTPPLRETETHAVVIPSAGLALDLSPHKVVDLFAEVSGLTLGDVGHVVDAEAGVRITLIKFLTITGGYRFFEVRGEEGSSFARLRLSGPFVGATFRF